MKDRDIETVLTIMAEKIRDLEITIMCKNTQIENLREELGKYNQPIEKRTREVILDE